MTFPTIKNKPWLPILAVLLAGVALAWLILRGPSSASVQHAGERSSAAEDPRPQHGEPGHEHAKDHGPLASSAHQHVAQPPEILKGPHGGKLFTQGAFGLEVTIYEREVPPEFRVYFYWQQAPIDPGLVQLDLTLTRLGRQPQVFGFSQEKDYLKGHTEVVEPHSFAVALAAEYRHQHYTFSYQQVEARVSLSAAQVLHNNIEVLTAGPASIQSTLKLLGEIKLNADKSVRIVPRVEGVVASVHANAGDTVRQGQVLAVVSSQQVAEVRSELQAASKRLNLAQATYAREKQLWEEKVSAQQDYLQAQHALQESEINVARIQQTLSALGAGASGQTRYEIRAPISGVVTGKQISQGQVVGPADTIFEVADLSTVWTEVTIYAKDLKTVRVGQQVTVKSAAFDAQSTGTIAYISALVGEQSRTATARVVLPNPHRQWLPGLPVNVALVAEEVKVPVAVSVEGLQTLRDWTVVFGRYGEYFEARPLKLGRRDEQSVEVLEGLAAGEQYAAGNSFVIKADLGKAGASHDH